MAAVAGGDAWRITGEDRAKHDAQFFTLKPVNGFISGDQARGFFMQSGLPTPILGQIWSLADMNNDGKMDKKEFSIAMHLIKKKLQGYELPKSLPHTLKADPSPVMGSFGTMPQPTGMAMGPQMGMPSMGMVAPVPMAVGPRVPMMSNGVPPMVPAQGFMGAPVSAAPGSFQGGVPVKQGAPAASTPGYAMPHNSKLKYTQMFNSNDRNKKGSLTGVEARAILVQTGVPQQMLAQIWNLSDYDKDGKLSCDEFCIAMHLTDLVKMGIVLPAKLPAELVPGKARSGSFGTVTPPPSAPPSAPRQDSFGDLLGTMGMPPTVQPATNGEPEVDDKDKGLPFTFEDRRKENFDKGQAELERRRQMLQEQLRKEEEARQEKERKEHEKRERQRQEQEMKKQQELERQMEKQRQIEKQKEEQRQKMMEQRESARRELERQRQMEWERQRKEQLMAEKAREYEQLMALKSQTSNFTCELESLQGKKTEISTKISQVKNGVTDFTAHIEAMRSTRDLKLADIERLQKELQDLSQKLKSVQSERQDLDLKVQTSVQNNPMSETHRTMMHSVELKRTSVQRLKKDLEEIEKQTETKLGEIDQANTEIKESDNKIQSLQSDLSKAEQQKKLDSKQQAEEADRVKKEKEKHEKLRKELEAQRLREEEEKKKKEASKASTDTSLGGNWFDFGGDTKTSSTNDNWASVFDSQPKTTSQSTNIWNSMSSQPSTATTVSVSDHDGKKIKLSGPTQKYKALYQFDARNADELSMLPGDTVMVYDDQTGAEPGWKGGEMNGKSGWFPEAYVEKIQESSQTVFGTDLSGSSNAISTSEESSFMAVPGKMPSVSPTPGQGKTAPEGLQAQALYPWKAKKENHLTFNKGDVISVREQQDMWWSGELNGKIGWFPKSYVKLISGPSASSTSNSLTNSPSVTPTSTLDKARDSPSVEKKDSEVFVAVYAYHSDVDGDLTFNQGEIIQVSKMEGDWWTGSVNDKTGIFPANYVKKSETQQQDSFSSLPPSASPSNLAGHSVFEQSSSPFPQDPFNDSPIVSNESSTLTSDPLAESISFASKDGISLNSGTTSSDDLFADFGCLSLASKSTDTVSAPEPLTQTAVTSVDPLSDLGSLGGGSPFLADPFADLSATALPAPTSKTETPKSNTPALDKTAEAASDFTNVGSSPFQGGSFTNLNSDSSPFPVETGETTLSSKPTSSLLDNTTLKQSLDDKTDKTADPFAALGPSLDESPFPSDPFAGSDAFGNDQMFSGESAAPAGTDISGKNVGSLSNPNGNTADPYAAFAALEDVKQSSSTLASDFPVPPTDWFTSVEKDALKSDSPVPGSLPDTSSQPFGANADFSIQTTVGDPFSSPNLGMSSQDQISTAESTEWFPSLSSLSNDTEPPPIPKKQGPQRPPPPPSLKRSLSKPDEQADGDSETTLPDKIPSLTFNQDPFKDHFFINSTAGSRPSISIEDSIDKLVLKSPFFTPIADKHNTSSQVKTQSTQVTSINTTLPTSTYSMSLQFQNLLSYNPDIENAAYSHGSGPQLLPKKHRAPPAPPIKQRPPKPPQPYVKKRKPPRLSKPSSKKRGLPSSDKRKPQRPTQLPSFKGSSRKGSQSSDGDDELTAVPKQGGGGGTLKKPEIATVIASYTATGPEQLSLNPGQLIQVRKKSPSGWWEGELQARGQKRKIGWFPANYVKLLGGSARSTPDNTLGGGTRGVSPAPGLANASPAPGSLQDQRSGNPSPAPQPVSQPPPATAPQPTPQTPPAKYVDHVIALYPYTAQHGDELTFLKDAVINVIKKEGNEWWQGECNGQIGMFPANYVTSTSPESTSWSTDPAVLAVTSSEEGKRQTYIHELINTEETYMEDMSVVMDAFYKPCQTSGVLTEVQLQTIFVNWQELIICNTKFLKALRVRKKMCGKGQVINMIGDMLCENIPHFKPYIRFCSCQLNAAALLQRLTEQSSQFREIHKKCVQNPKTKGMPLSSFLLKPMQRITKYPLIVEKILKYTAESHPDHQQLVDALEHTQELCNQVNEGVREKENSDRLEWIQQHVQCDGLPEKITFNSVTNCLGPRKVLYTGVVCKAKSNKELGAFLFNDFLLLTTSNRPLNSTHSLFDVTGLVQYKMYKTPVFLNEVMVKKPTEDDGDVFHLSHIDRVYNLRCHSQTDRDTWVRKLETASRHYLDTERKKRDKAMSLRRSQGVGRLLVVIMEGIDLMASDANGKSDPYCEVSMGSQEHKTKVINNTLNPKWNASMQFSIQNVDTDTLCITVFDRDLFSPNDFLGRTEIQVKEIMKEAGEHGRRPITKHLLLHEVSTGEIVVKLDLHLFDQT